MNKNPDHRIVHVALDSRSYPVVIGSGTRRLFPDYFARTGCRRAFWATDANVAVRWQADLGAVHDPADDLAVLPPGEDQKKLVTVENLCRRLVTFGAERDDALVACGGGVIGDITGFTAGVYQRGIAFIQIPTTLLAMVDASVGGKTGVDLPEGKNLVGMFHQPAFVLADTDFLSTLPSRELCCGFAEVVKTALIGGGQLFVELGRYKELGVGAISNYAELIEPCVAFKAQVVAEDEIEKGRRVILNFGHTIGHALETAGEFDYLKHCEAVFWGMIAAVDLSQRLGLLKAASARQALALVEPFLPLIPTFDFSPDHVIQLITTDKKVRGGRPRFILLEEIGKPVIRGDVPEAELRAVLEKLRAKMSSNGKS